MNMRHVLRWMMIGLVLCAMLSCCAAAEESAEVSTEASDGVSAEASAEELAEIAVEVPAEAPSIAVGIYVVNSQKTIEDANTVPLIVNAALTSAVFPSELGRVALLITKSDARTGDSTTVLEVPQITPEHIGQVVDAVSGIQSRPLKPGDLDKRVDGLSSLASALEATNAPRKLLIMFTSMNEWSEEYTAVVHGFSGEVLLVRLMPNQADIGLPTDVENLTIQAVNGYDSQIMLEAARLIGLEPAVTGSTIIQCVQAGEKDKYQDPQRAEIAQRALLLVGPVGEAVEGADYQNEHLRLLHLDAGQVDPLRFPAGTTAYIIDRVDHYGIIMTETLQDGRLLLPKGKAVEVACDILRMSTSQAANISSWQAYFMVTNEQGVVAEYPLTLEPSTGHYTGEVTLPWSGDGICAFRAVNDLGVEITSNTYALFVQNAAPTAKEETLALGLWLRSPVALNASVDLSAYFEDDDLSTVTYEIAPERPGLVIEGAVLTLSVEDEGVEPLRGMITATDAEGETAQIPLQIDVYDTWKILEEGTWALQADATEVSKGESIAVAAEYRFSEAGQAYFQRLEQEGLKREFLALLEAAFTLSDDIESLDVVIPVTVEEGSDSLRYTAQVTFPTESGAYALEGRLTGQAAEETAFYQAEERLSFEVVNQAPQVLQEGAGFALVLPDWLGGSEEQLQETETLRMNEFIAGEPGETLRITLTGTSLQLYREDEQTYVLTDRLPEGAEAVEAMLWRTEDVAPSLRIALSKPAKEVSLGLAVCDNNVAYAAQEIQISGSVRTVHQELFMILAIVLAALIAGTVLFLVIRQALKPSLKQQRLEMILPNQRVYVLPLDSWNKQRLTLWEAILCTGLPLICDGATYEELEKLQLTAARKQQYGLIRAKGSTVTLQAENGTQLEGSPVQVNLGQYVVLVLQGEDVLKLRVTMGVLSL